MVDAGPAPVSLSFGKKTKTIYEGRKMNVGNNTIPRPDNILACGKSCIPTVTAFLTGVPQPPGFSRLQPLVGLEMIFRLRRDRRLYPLAVSFGLERSARRRGGRSGTVSRKLQPRITAEAGGKAAVGGEDATLLRRAGQKCRPE